MSSGLRGRPYLKNKMEVGWRDSSEVKSNGCSFWAPHFDSQHSHGGLQPSITTVPGRGIWHPVWSSDGTRYTCSAQTNRLEKHPHTSNKIKWEVTEQWTLHWPLASAQNACPYTLYTHHDTYAHMHAYTCTHMRGRNANCLLRMDSENSCLFPSKSIKFKSFYELLLTGLLAEILRKQSPEPRTQWPTRLASDLGS